jgi:hypothetical protein
MTLSLGETFICDKSSAWEARQIAYLCVGFCESVIAYFEARLDGYESLRSIQPLPEKSMRKYGKSDEAKCPSQART